MIPNMSRPALASMLALAAVAAAGCGGDDETSAKTETSATSEFVAKAEAICADANRKEARLEPAGGTAQPNFKDAAFIAKFNAIGEDALKQLRAIAQPADPAAVDTFYASVERMLAARYVGEWESAYLDRATAAGPAGFTECQGLGD